MRSLTHIIKCFYKVYGACFHQQLVIYPSHNSFFFKIWSVVLQCCVEKAMAPHSSTLAWKIPWTEEPGRLQSMGSLRVRHD